MPAKKGPPQVLHCREAAGRTAAILQRHDKGAAVVGRVETFTSRGEVRLHIIGGSRPLDMLTGEQLPRIS